MSDDASRSREPAARVPLRPGDPAQEPKSAIEQMHAYRECLRPELPGAIAVLGVVEFSELAPADVLAQIAAERGASPDEDVYAFCSASELAGVLGALGVGAK